MSFCSMMPFTTRTAEPFSPYSIVKLLFTPRAHCSQGVFSDIQKPVPRGVPAEACEQIYPSSVLQNAAISYARCWAICGSRGQSGKAP